MENWSTIQMRNGATYYSTHISRLDSSQNGVFIWDKFFSDVVSANADIDWDFVRVEIWCDSGRVLIFPAKRGTENRIDVSGIEVVIDDLKDSYEKLAYDDVSDDAFDRWVDLKILDTANLLRSGVEAMEGVSRNVDVVFFNADGQSPITVTMPRGQ